MRSLCNRIYYAILKRKTVCWAAALSFHALLGAGFLQAQSMPDFPLELISEEEYIKLAPTSRATFQLGARNLIVCRGADFKGEPPTTPGMQIEWQGQVYTSSGRWNNRIVASLWNTSRDNKDALRQARDQLQLGLQSDPEFWPFLFNQARVHMVLAEFERARELFLRAERLLPGYSGLDLQLGLVYMRLKNESRALYHWKRAYRRDPRDVRSLLALADYYRQQKSYARSWRYLEEARKHSPAHRSVWLAKARWLWQQGKANQARRLLENKQYDFPEDKRKGSPIPVLYYQAELNFSLRDYQEAERLYDLLLKNQNDAFWWHMDRASIQKRLRQSRTYQLD